MVQISQISEDEALLAVCNMLEGLMNVHDSLRPRRSDRRPSYEEALEDAAKVVRLLTPSKAISGICTSDDESAIENSEVDAADAVDEARTVDPAKLYRSFWLKSAPNLTIAQYLERHKRYCSSSPATYLTAGHLIYKLAVEQQAIPVTRLNVYRLFGAAFVVSAKLIEDVLYPMSRYATTAGLAKPVLCQLELALLLMIEYDIWIDANILQESIDLWESSNFGSYVAQENHDPSRKRVTAEVEIENNGCGNKTA